MILGIEHIALSCRDVARSSQVLSASGYDVRFVEEKLINHASKKPFLISYQPLHDITYCWSKDSISVELVDHGSPIDYSLPQYLAFFSGAPSEIIPWDKQAVPETDIFSRIGKDLFGKTILNLALWKPFNTPIWYVEKTDDLQRSYVKYVMVAASDFRASQQFWTEGMGFCVARRGTSDGREWSHLHFRAVVPRWSLDLVLVDGEKNKDLSFLDRAGFNCIAFLVNDIDVDSRMLTQHGSIITSEVFNMKVAAKELKISVLRGPSNELIELIEITT